MSKRILLVLLVACLALSLASYGCKRKTEKAEEMVSMETPSGMPVEEAVTTPVTEPAQTVATETIPPTAAPELQEKAPAIPVGTMARDKEIQTALKAAGFYAGSIDGKIGPRTKKAIEEFQKANGLQVDGKVGPKTWAELEKYLRQQ